MSDDILAELVEGERAALQPSVGARKATWKRVARSVAIAAPVPTMPPGASAVTKVATSGLAAWLKGIALLALGGALVVGVGTVVRDRTDAEPAAPALREADSAVAVPVPATAADDIDGEVRSIAASPEPSIGENEARIDPPPPSPNGIDPAPSERAAAARSIRSRTRTEAREPSADAPALASTLAEEAELVLAARRDLNAGDPRAALASLRAHARRFPDGQLTEERIALGARALCESGERARGLQEAAALRAAFPASSHLSRVVRACE